MKKEDYCVHCHPAAVDLTDNIKDIDNGELENNEHDDDAEEANERRNMITRIVYSAILFAIAFLISHTVQILDGNGLTPADFVYVLSFLIIGYDILWRAVKNIIKAQVMDEAFLMSVATIGAIAIGEYPEAVMVMLLYQVGELFQDMAVGKARKSIRALSALLPDTVRVIRAGKETIVKPRDVNVGEIVVARPGEKIALDGIIVEPGGENFSEITAKTSADKGAVSSARVYTFDTKAITGESVPRELRAGDSVLSGYVNLETTVSIKTTATEKESAAAVIMRLTEESAARKAKSELFITKFSKVYTPAVVILAVLIAAVPMLTAGRFSSDYLTRALSFLVVSCPCALVISVPLAYFSGIGAASKRGVLIKGSATVDVLANVSDVVFDKTGTLTTGDFTVTAVNAADGVKETDVLKYAAVAESGSNHPIAKAIVKTYLNVYGGKANENVSVRDIPGSGIEAQTDFGVIAVKKAETGVDVFKDGNKAGNIVVSDSPRANSAVTVTNLKNMKVTSHMLTGDRAQNAAVTAEAVGIADVHADLLPQGKVDALDDIKKAAPGTVVFVGDGINDAPVLALSDCGIAMGGLGQAAAVETADAVIADDDPLKVITAITLSKRTRARAVQNIVFSLAVKFTVLTLSALGLTGLELAVFADVGVSVLAVVNAMRGGRDMETPRRLLSYVY